MPLKEATTVGLVSQGDVEPSPNCPKLLAPHVYISPPDKKCKECPDDNMSLFYHVHDKVCF